MMTKREKEKMKKKLSEGDESILPLLHALADKTRFRIFRLLLGGKELCVTEVASVADISVPAASQHFRVLEMTGIVEAHRYGQTTCYQVRKKDERVKRMVKLLR